MLLGVEFARQSGVLFGFIHTVTTQTWEKLLWLADFACNQGAKLLQLHPLELAGRAASEFSHLLPSQECLHKVYILCAYLKEKYAGRMQIHFDFFHRDIILQFPTIVNWYGDNFEINRDNFLKVLRSVIVVENGDIFPLSYGFDKTFLIGNIAEIKEGKDIFFDFMQRKGRILYNLFGETFHEIESDLETDMVTWTSMLVTQSKKKLPQGIK